MAPLHAAWGGAVLAAIASEDRVRPAQKCHLSYALIQASYMRTGENIYWLFSTALEVIATFVGLLGAGFFFFHSRIDEVVKQDETLVEIYAEIKRQIYRRFKALFALTGLSIILGLLIIYLNAFVAGTGWQVFVVLVGALNIFTIAWAGWFFIFIVDPDIISHTAERLVRENKEIFNKKRKGNITKKEFNDKYWELNTLLRSIAAKTLIAKAGDAVIPFAELARELNEKGVINNEQLQELSQINKTRNISSHSAVNFIQGDIGASADKLNHELHTIDEMKDEGR